MLFTENCKIPAVNLYRAVMMSRIDSKAVKVKGQSSFFKIHFR